MINQAQIQRLLVSLGLVLLAGLYWMIFIEPFIPNANGRLGHDYLGNLPEMLTGYVHFEKAGWFTWPWFTPATCAGNMYIAGVANPYINVQQWLTFAFDLLTAAKLNFLLFAALGALGTYLLLKNPFRLSPEAACLGAVIFMFNGFFAYRMIIGHVSFHSFMLTPLIAWLLLMAGDRLRHALVAGLLFAYITLASGIYTLLPVVMSVTGIVLVHNLVDTGRRFTPHLWFALALFVAFLLSLFKISLAFSVAENFERDQYPLPGIPGIATGIILPIRVLFFSTPEWLTESQFLFTNYYWKVDRHELEMGVGWVVLLILVAGAILSRGRFLRNLDGTGRVMLALLCLLLSTPILLNHYSPGWNDLIKSVPVLKSFSLFVRMYAIYIPVIVVLTAIALHSFTRYRVFIAVAAGVLVIATHWMTDKGYYDNQAFDPSLLRDYDLAYRSGQFPIPDINQVTNVGAINYDGAAVRVRNETFVYGATNMNCHNDMFGYRLENFPGVEQLVPEASPMLETPAGFNMKNPACFVFPEANQCAPGDHFQLRQRGELERFLGYRQFAFNMPGYQHAANWCSGLTFLITLLLIALRSLRSPVCSG